MFIFSQKCNKNARDLLQRPCQQGREYAPSLDRNHGEGIAALLEACRCEGGSITAGLEVLLHHLLDHASSMP